MQIIISQDGERFIAITERNIFVDIVPLSVDEEKKIHIYSVGIDSISFGTYKTKTRAKEVFRALIDFVLGEIPLRGHVHDIPTSCKAIEIDSKHKFKMPADTD